jgi:uncharacterized protein
MEDGVSKGTSAAGAQGTPRDRAARTSAVEVTTGDQPSRCAVLVFVREPVPGRVKTRLAAEIGDAAALRAYRRLAERAVAAARGLGGGAEVRILHSPADAGDAVRRWLGEGPRYLPQQEGDLGHRMRSAVDDAFAAGAARVAVIGSDLPGMSTDLLRRAFALLDAATAVLGPAADGGYYLLALDRPVPAAFDEVPWSTDRVLATTVDRLRSAGIEPVLLETLRDVDRAADLPDGFLGA